MELTKRTQQTFTRSGELQILEDRIHAHLNCAYAQIVEVGRCLNEAKERKLVPHGAWGEWLNEVAGMNERQAQQWMRIAREVPADSVLATLEYSKIRAIMALPDPEQREEVAKAAKEEHATVRELEDCIRKLTAERDKARQDKAAAESSKGRLIEDAQRTVTRLQGEIAELKAAAQEPTAISPAAQAEIDRLSGKLKDAEMIAKLQSEKRVEAQRQLIELQKEMKGSPRSSAASGLTGAEVLAAARAFLGACGAVPHMGAELASMDSRERRLYEQALDIVRVWCRGAGEALDTVVVG